MWILRLLTTVGRLYRALVSATLDIDIKKRRECGCWRIIYKFPPNQRLLCRVMAIRSAEEVVIVDNQGNKDG